MIKTCLKKPDYEDLKFIRSMWADPPTMEDVGGVVILTDEQADQWYKKLVDPGSSSHCYRLILNQDFQPVGEVSFHDYVATGKARFNIKILYSRRGQGYGKSAMFQLLDYFFNNLNGEIMEDNLAPGNKTGQKMLINFGFQLDHSRTDVVRLYLTRDVFNKRYKSGVMY